MLIKTFEEKYQDDEKVCNNQRQWKNVVMWEQMITSASERDYLDITK